MTRRDYYRIDWPIVTRSRECGVYAEETLAVCALFDGDGLAVVAVRVVGP